jgi:hypothetical protein
MKNIGRKLTMTAKVAVMSGGDAVDREAQHQIDRQGQSEDDRHRDRHDQRFAPSQSQG